MELTTVSSLFTEQVLLAAVQRIFQQRTGCAAPKALGHTISFASSKGDGFLGILYRVTVTLEGEARPVKLVAKGMPANRARRESCRCAHFFHKEVVFYTQLVPALQDFERRQRGQGSDDSLLAVPECYHAVSDGVNDLLVMEDLTESSLETLERSSGLSSLHMTTMFRQLARLHAVSLAMRHLEPAKYAELAQSIPESILTPELRPWIEQYLIRLTRIFLTAAESDLSDPTLIDRFNKFTDPETYFNRMMSLVNNNQHRVFCHGDPWIANFMFHTSDPSIMKAIDFQLVRDACFMCDLSSVIFACTSGEERAHVGGVDGILSLYHTELRRAVLALGGPETACPSLQEVRTLWRDVGAFGLGASIELITLSVYDSDHAADIDSLPADSPPIPLEEFLSGMEIRSPQAKRRVAEIIQLAVTEGLI